MGRSTGEGQERQSSTEEREALAEAAALVTVTEAEELRRMLAASLDVPPSMLLTGPEASTRSAAGALTGSNAAEPCPCSCHGCCVPLDETCEDCPEYHPAGPA